MTEEQLRLANVEYSNKQKQLIKLLIEEQKHLSACVNAAGAGHLAFDQEARLRLQEINKLCVELKVNEY